MAAAVAVVSGLAVLSANAAAAAPVPLPETGNPGELVLASQPAVVVFPQMSPGTRGVAEVDLELVNKPWGDTTIAFETSGTIMTHPSGLALGVRACAQDWVGVPTVAESTSAPLPTCPRGERTVMPLTPGSQFLNGAPLHLSTYPAGVIRPTRPAHLLLVLELPVSGATDPTLMGLSGDFAARVTAMGDETIVLPEDPDPDPDPAPGAPGSGNGGTDTSASGIDDLLASSGASVMGWSLLGAGAIALGALALRTARRRNS